MNAEPRKSSAEQTASTQEVDYDIVIVGSGPAGLSAAARAQQLGCRYVLLEAQAQASDTIYNYQKGKHVMAEPSILPLRSGMPFGPGKREAILGTWDEQLQAQHIHIQYRKKVTGIQGMKEGGLFELLCEDSTRLRSRNVILAIGLQGNIRKMGVPGQDLPQVQYTLSNPDEFKNETIVVLGAGNAGVENALALRGNNRVILGNRGGEFNMCMEANRQDILEADRKEELEIFYNIDTVRVEALPVSTPGEPGLLWVYKGAEGEQSLPVHRIIARLGAIPPRKLVEGFGVEFPNADPSAVPALSERYESNVPGLYIVGALGGYPLIKQAMNQGHEVVDMIMGLPVVPADEPLLAKKFEPLGAQPVPEVLAMIQSNVPLFAQMTRLQLREFMLESQMHQPEQGRVIFRKGDYTSTFYTVVRGRVDVELLNKQGKNYLLPLHAGDYFGEMGLISGRRRTATVYAGPDCVLIETPRKAMLKLIASVDSVRRTIDEVFVRRAVSTHMAPQLDSAEIDILVNAGIEARSLARGDLIFKEGDPCDGLYLIRRGSVAVSRLIGDKDVVLTYLSAGNYFGALDIVRGQRRSHTARATVLTELLVLKVEAVKAVLALNENWRKALLGKISGEVQSAIFRESKASRNNDLIRFLMAEGMGDATNALVIDESLCVQCDNCEKACAETHGGVPRLDRDEGPTFQNFHLPHSCRHCEQPHCMKDCPPDAIRRSESGEVMINDTCIGCGNCAKNCPYESIQLRVKPPKKKGNLLSWLLLGLGDGMGERTSPEHPDAVKKAMKCDLCTDRPQGPACVQSCPTGAAFRISPEILLNQEDSLLL